MSAHTSTIDVIRARVRADVDRERVRDAAPDLLAALGEALALLDYMASDRETALNHKTLVRARAAIAKAGGAT